MNEIKQPYVLIIGLLLFAAVVIISAVSPGHAEKGAVLFAVALTTGMATKACVSMKMGAANTGVGLFILAVAALVAPMLILGADDVADLLLASGLESVLSGLGGLGVALLGEAQVRPREDE